MTVEASNDHTNQTHGQESAAASELAASAAQLRLLMQKLIANRSQHVQKQDDSAPQAPHQPRDGHKRETLTTTPPAEAFVSDSNSTAVAQQGQPRTPNTETAQQRCIASQAVETPGMNSLAAQARDLLQEIEAAAAASPDVLQAGSPQLAQLDPAKARRVLPFSAEEQQPQHQQSRLAVASNNILLQQTAGVVQEPGRTIADGAASMPSMADAAIGLPASSVSLADSNTWSVALQQYQLHRQQSAALLEQQQQTADSCSSSKRPMAPTTAATDSQISGGDTSAAAAAHQRVTPTTATFNMQHEPPAAAAAATANPLAARLAAACSILQPVGTAADSLASLQQQPHHAAAAKASCTERLSPESVRLRVKALRGPLEDAMRCCSELQEVREEASLLRAHNTRLTAAAESWEAERSYLLAERKLQAAQRRQLAVLLAADAGTSTCAAVCSHEAAQQQVADAEQQLETHWRLLPADSKLKPTSGPAQLAHDFATVTTEVEAAIGRRQRQVDQLTQQLRDTHTELLQQRQQAEQLQQQLVGVRQAADVALQQELADVQVRGERKLLKAEQKLLKLAQVHQTAVAEFQQQIQQHRDQAAAAQQQHQRWYDEQQALQQRIETLEAQRDQIQEEVQTERETRQAAEERVACLQAERQELLSALSALEKSLSDAQKTAKEQEVLRQRLEDTVQAKALAVMETKQELRDVNLVAQNAQAEIQQLQEQLGSLKSKAADTARQLSAARTAVHEANQELSVEQRRGQQQAALMDDLRVELDKARRATATAQKAQAAEAKHAAAAESAAAAAVHAELSAAHDAAAEAEASLLDSRKECKQLQQQHQILQQQCKSLQQQLADCTAERQQDVARFGQELAAMQRRAEAAEADLMAIRQDVAGWVATRSKEHYELQETRAKLVETSADLGVALQRAAACGVQVRLNNNSRAAANRTGSAGAAGPGTEQARSSVSPAKGRGPAGAQGHSGCAEGQQMQQLPLEVARQLQWQAGEVLRLQNKVRQLQQQLHNAEQQLGSSQDELRSARQQLAAAEDAVAWHRQQQGQVKAADGQLQQQQRVQQLERELSAADGRIAELTSQLSAARAEAILLQRKHVAEVRQLQEQLIAAEATVAALHQQLQQSKHLQMGPWQHVVYQGRHWQQQQKQQADGDAGWADSVGPATQEWQGHQRLGEGAAESCLRQQRSHSGSSSSSISSRGARSSMEHHATAQQQQQKQQPDSVGSAKVPSRRPRQAAGAAAAANQLSHAAEAYAALVAGDTTQAAMHVQAAEATREPPAATSSRGAIRASATNQAFAAAVGSAAAGVVADHEQGNIGEALSRASSIGSSRGNSVSSARPHKAVHGRRPGTKARSLAAADHPAGTAAAANSSKQEHRQRTTPHSGPRAARGRSASTCISNTRQKRQSSPGESAKRQPSSRPSSARSAGTQPSGVGSPETNGEGEWETPAWEDSKCGSEQWDLATASSVDYHGAIAAATAALDAATASMPRV